MAGEIQVLPECTIPCCDLWQPGQLSAHKMDAYKALRETGEIRIKRVTYSKETGFVIVEYWSTLPHEWTLDALRAKSLSIISQAKQISMEVS